MYTCKLLFVGKYILLSFDYYYYPGTCLGAVKVFLLHVVLKCEHITSQPPRTIQTQLCQTQH
jgi:hypothetical protein